MEARWPCLNVATICGVTNLVAPPRQYTDSCCRSSVFHENNSQYCADGHSAFEYDSPFKGVISCPHVKLKADEVDRIVYVSRDIFYNENPAPDVLYIFTHDNMSLGLYRIKTTGWRYAICLCIEAYRYH